MPETWTVARILSWMAKDFAALQIPSARLDAELLLCQVLGCDRVRLYMDMHRPLDATELEATRALVQRRRRREPVAYILGEKEFYRRPFQVTQAVLVPRPETELLVDRALEVLPPGAAHALDLCTGSGAVAVTLAAERPTLQVDATDLSPQALAIARANAMRHQVTARCEMFEGDLFAPLPEGRSYSVITANPPYVANGEWSGLAPEITQHEPKLAFLAGTDGLDVLRRICAQAPAHLEPGGVLLLEIGAGQAENVKQLLTQTQRFEHIATHRDLGSIERVVEARLMLTV